MADVEVRLGAWSASGGAGSEGFFIEEWDGWHSPPAARHETDERVNAHGAHDSVGWRESRIVTLKGTCETTDAHRMIQYQREFTALLAGGQMGRLTVDDPLGTQWADVRLKKPYWSEVIWGQITNWELQLWAPDSRKFGESRTFTGAAPVFNRGNFPARPVFTVEGNQPGGYTITNGSGKKIVVTGALTPGAPHTIDTATGIVRVGGAVAYGMLQQFDAWTVAGAQKVTHTITGGTLTTTLTDTYI